MDMPSEKQLKICTGNHSVTNIHVGYLELCEWGGIKVLVVERSCKTMQHRRSAQKGLRTLAPM